MAQAYFCALIQAANFLMSPLGKWPIGGMGAHDHRINILVV